METTPSSSIEDNLFESFFDCAIGANLVSEPAIYILKGPN
jgi:hypothetical protein